ncbi:MAG: hypothetical protein L0177_00690, partial [Chloroflexi bacterium]|nr:hypothetical protein [Chloroflexota bacterium]
MRKRILRNVGALALLLAALTGFVAIPMTSALAIEPPKATQGTTIDVASVQEEVNALRAEVAKISRQVNGRNEPSEHPMSGYCHSLSETVRASGVV